jgi:hypothetical protein
MQPPVLPTSEHLRQVAAQSAVPIWVPWPLPAGWLVTGLAWAGDDRGRLRAVAVACTGPNPLGGTGDMVLVAEEPGVGLGARYAGIPGPDPGGQLASSPSDAKIETSGHPTPLWSVHGPLVLCRRGRRCLALAGPVARNHGPSHARPAHAGRCPRPRLLLRSARRGALSAPVKCSRVVLRPSSGAGPSQRSDMRAPSRAGRGPSSRRTGRLIVARDLCAGRSERMPKAM